MLAIKSISVQREPAVAGKFYAGEKKALSSSIDELLEKAQPEAKGLANAVSYVAPHAGYHYSGQVEAFTYKALSMKKDLDRIDTFVFVGPNHTGLGYPVSISHSDWKTAFGIVKNDTELADEIASKSDTFEIDETAHKFEHSIEVQLPFLQKVVENPRCCFVCMADQSIDCCKRLSEAIIKSAKKMERNITVIASSDFNHYESAKIAESKDMPALEALKKLDLEGFYASIKKLDDSCCGYGPITVSGMFAKARGARSGVVLGYANSGDITKDYKAVVAYSSIVFI